MYIYSVVSNQSEKLQNVCRSLNVMLNSELNLLSDLLEKLQNPL